MDTDYASLIRTEPNAATMREEIADGIEQSQNDASSAVNTAENANNTANTANDRVNNIVANQGSSESTEVIDSHHDNTTNTTYNSLGARLDANSSSLADIAVHVTTFGAKGDGVTDDTQAIINCIEYAKTNNIGYIIFPWGSTGVYLCNSSICNATVLPEGLKFIATGRQGGNDNTDGIIIKYTGTNILWNIITPNGLSEVGQWSWENFTFQATNDAGTLFQFNDVTLEKTDTSSTACYIREVCFKNCNFWGTGTTEVTGNAIQGLGVFELTTDEHCYFRGWKRAVYLKGCDNCTIKGRFNINIRHIMAIRSNTFGNALTIDARFLGAVINGGCEAAYQIYDAASSTTIISPFIEGTATAGMYLNGTTGAIYSPWFSLISTDVPIWLGADATDYVMYTPQTTGSTSDIIYDIPSSWKSTANGLSNSKLNQLVIYSPSSRFRRSLSQNPRLKIYSPFDDNSVLNKTPIVKSLGLSSQGNLLTAFNLERSYDMGGFPFPNNVIADINAFNGFTIQLDPNTSIMERIIIGKDFFNGQQIKISIMYLNEDISGSLMYIISKNGVNISSGNMPSTISYSKYEKIYNINDCVAGDTLDIGVYNTDTINSRLSYVMVELDNAVLKGPTTNRPTTDLFIGCEYLDTTLNINGKPIKWNGVSWIDYTGTIV